MNIDRQEFERRGLLPWDSQPMLGVENYGEMAAQRWGADWDHRQFMHWESRGAWDVLYPGMVPTFFDIEDSIQSGGYLVTQAARKTFEMNGPAQTDPALLRFELLVILWGIARGTRIFGGQEKDPNKGALLSAKKIDGRWVVVVGEVPITLPPPPVEPPVPPTLPGGVPRPPLAAMNTLQDARNWFSPIFRPRQRERYNEAMDAFEDWMASLP